MEPEPAFAVWITGLPASGKSTVTGALRSQLAGLGVDSAVLESDALRRIFTPHARYQPEDRDLFYRQVAYVGSLLTKHGVPVIFDATANLRRYREEARHQIPKFVEAFMDCPLEVCMARDPKGIYSRAREDEAGTVPGLQAVYEPPLSPDVTIRHGEGPEESARRIVELLQAKGFLSGRDPRA